MAKKEYFKSYKDNSSPSKEDIRGFLEEAKKVDEFVKEWDLDPYEQYLCDLYMIVGKYFGWSQQEFDNTSVDKIMYYRDKIMESLENNCSDSPGSLPINYEHWALILTMKQLFGKKKR